MLDYIIVGQGIAGSTLALSLLKHKQKVCVLDNDYKHSSSLIAGGLVHPVSFRRTILSWKAEKLSPFSIEYYKNLEKELDVSFFEPLTFLRLFGSFEEQNTWFAKRSSSPFDQVLSDTDIDLTPYAIKTPFGIGKVNWSYRVHLNVFLPAIKDLLKEKNAYRSDFFEYQKLYISNNYIEYKGLKAKNIIFCEGHQYINNPLFKYLPQNLTKGEILILKSNQLPPYTLSRNCFVLPMSSQTFILGATYDWNDTSYDKTNKARKELLDKFNKISDIAPEIIEHKAGIRPTTHDRKPWLGKHRSLNNVFIFNGLGSKGVLLAPYFSEQMSRFLVFNQPLDKEINIERLKTV